MILTNTEIKYIDNIDTSLEILEKFGLELDLNLSLEEEFDFELPSDINNAW